MYKCRHFFENECEQLPISLESVNELLVNAIDAYVEIPGKKSYMFLRILATLMITGSRLRTTNFGRLCLGGLWLPNQEQLVGKNKESISRRHYQRVWFRPQHCGDS